MLKSDIEEEVIIYTKGRNKKPIVIRCSFDNDCSEQNDEYFDEEIYKLIMINSSKNNNVTNI